MARQLWIPRSTSVNPDEQRTASSGSIASVDVHLSPGRHCSGAVPAADAILATAARVVRACVDGPPMARRQGGWASLAVQRQAYIIEDPEDADWQFLLAHARAQADRRPRARRHNPDVDVALRWQHSSARCIYGMKHGDACVALDLLMSPACKPHPYYSSDLSQRTCRLYRQPWLPRRDRKNARWRTRVWPHSVVG
jgi:hypothetical protein